jgi:S1-C subfamily serine protease
MRNIGSRRPTAAAAWFLIAGCLAVLTAAQWANGPVLATQDLEEALGALVRVRATVPAEATTARGLGTEREGNGVLIGDQGLVLTIGYLIVEAEAIEVEGRRGSLPADFVAYDPNTGFGLLRARGLIGARPLPLGDSSSIEVGDGLHVAGFGRPALEVRLIQRGQFVGTWEYLLEEALYAAPAFPEFGGAALIHDGRLVGVGSILTSFILPGVGRMPCNMFVPVNLLKPILAEMVRAGRSGLPARPWLGLNTEEAEGRVVVTQVTPAGPAELAGLRRGDLILAVEQAPVSGVADFYRRLWAAGPAGVTVRLRVLQGDRVRELSVRSVDRHERLLRPVPRPGGGQTASLPRS